MRGGGPLTLAQTRAVQAFLAAWWRHFLTTEVDGRDAFDTQALLLTGGDELTSRLREWREHGHPNATWHLAVFLRWSLLPEVGELSVCLPGHPEAGPELREWVSDPALEQWLEDAFIADPDGPAAAEISHALTWWRGSVLGLWGPKP